MSDKSVKELKLILERGICAWGKCYFCGWGKKLVEAEVDELKRKLESFLRKHSSPNSVVRLKIFSSGSFLDEKQFPKDFVKFVIKTAEKYGVEELVIESRPEFVTDENLRLLRSDKVRVTVAMGLEIADDDVLMKLYRKGFRVKDYLKAVETLRRNGFGVRTYVLVNGHPALYKNPDLQKKLLDKTMKVALKVADSVVIINAYPHLRADLWNDWIEGGWRPLDEKQFYELVGKWRENPKVELDFNNYYFIPKFPREKRVFLKGVGREYLVHPYYEVWQDYFVRFYRPPEGKEYVLFLPCAYKKPYTRSKTWKAILSAISGYPFFKKLHLIAVSSPGVIPYEYINYYPFNAYDWPEWLETEEIKKEYVEVTKERVKKYVQAHDSSYKLYFAYFRPDSDSIEAIKLAFEELGLTQKLVLVLDYGTYSKVVREGFKPPVAHPLALQKLREVLKRYLD